MKVLPYFAILLMASLPCFVAPASADVLIAIDKGSQSMIVSVNGAPLYNWAVSTGMRGRETPAGAFKPFRMEADHFSKEWDDAPMPHSIFFTKMGHAIHGSGHRIGSPVSHGCVRLSQTHAATLYALVEAEGLSKTRVVVAGTEPALAEDRITQSGRSTHDTNRRSAKRQVRPRDWLSEEEDDDPSSGYDGETSLYADPYADSHLGNSFESNPGAGTLRSYRIFPEDEDPHLHGEWE